MITTNLWGGANILMLIVLIFGCVPVWIYCIRTTDVVIPATRTNDTTAIDKILFIEFAYYLIYKSVLNTLNIKGWWTPSSFFYFMSLAVVTSMASQMWFNKYEFRTFRHFYTLLSSILANMAIEFCQGNISWKFDIKLM